MTPNCVDVVRVLFVFVLFLEVQTSTKFAAFCPVRPSADEAGSQGSCWCTFLDEIQCRGLTAVPEVDVEALYAGRRTYRSLYLARQLIRRLPGASFAALNVRRIVLDFNPLGGRIDPRAFRGTVDVVDLARLGLVSRRRRISHRDDGPVGSERLRYFNASASNNKTGSGRAKVSTADQSRRYD